MAELEHDTYLETLDSDVLLVRETESNEVEHGEDWVIVESHQTPKLKRRGAPRPLRLLYLSWATIVLPAGNSTAVARKQILSGCLY